MRQLDVLHKDMHPEELRKIANERIHTGGAGRVKWTREESRRLKDTGNLALGAQQDE